MVWMVYSHYETDYFRIMAASFVVNMVSVVVAHLGRRGLLKTTNRTGRP